MADSTDGASVPGRALAAGSTMSQQRMQPAPQKQRDRGEPNLLSCAMHAKHVKGEARSRIVIAPAASAPLAAAKAAKTE